MNDKKIKAIVNYLMCCYEDMTIAEVRKLLKKLVKLGVTKLGNITLTDSYINSINEVVFNN